MIFYTVGVLTGVYLGFSIKKEMDKRADLKAPNQKDRQKILALLETSQKITNDDVEKLLKVSDATATRYLDKLEQAGHIKQNGKTGRNVFYTKTEV